MPMSRKYVSHLQRQQTPHRVCVPSFSQQEETCCLFPLTVDLLKTYPDTLVIYQLSRHPLV